MLISPVLETINLQTTAGLPPPRIGFGDTLSFDVNADGEALDFLEVAFQEEIPSRLPGLLGHRGPTALCHHDGTSPPRLHGARNPRTSADRVRGGFRLPRRLGLV